MMKHAKYVFLSAIAFGSWTFTISSAGAVKASALETHAVKTATQSVQITHRFQYHPGATPILTRHIPGMVVQVVSPDKYFSVTAGLASLTSLEPIKKHDVMPTGSAGKPMIALLTAMLHEEGLLDLDNTLGHWLPAALVAQIPYGRVMTLRQLLMHTAGIYNYTDNFDFFSALLSQPDLMRTDSNIIGFGLNRPASFFPGSDFSYSNTGYVLAGLILDSVLGEHHSNALRRRVLQPLGMNATFYKGIEQERGDFISGYTTIDDESQIVDAKPYQQNLARANAPVVSNVQDLAVFLKNLVDNEGLFSATLRGIMLGDDAVTPVDDYYYGLGIEYQIINDQWVFFHNGLEPGYTTYNVYIRDSQTSITALFNCGGYTACEMESEAIILQILNAEL